MADLYIDASAIVAILNNEPEYDCFQQKLAEAGQIYSSAISKYEALASLIYTRKPKDKAAPPHLMATIESLVEEFFADNSIRLIPIAEAEAQAAARAYMLYGKGTGAKANLNMGDCFSYACAAAHSLPLLYKGNDFIHTDITCA